MQNKPKILLVITLSEPWGGAQRYVFDLATGLTDKYEVLIASGAAKKGSGLFGKIEEWNRQNKDKKVGYTPLTHLHRAISPLQDMKAVLELRTLIQKQQPALVHMNSSKASIIGSKAVHGLKHKPKTVYTAHGWVFNEPLAFWRKALYRYLEKKYGKKKDVVITLSPADNDSAKKIGLKNNTTTIPLGVGNVPKNKKDIRKEFGIPKDVFLFGTIANFYKTKALDQLLAAFGELKKTKKDFQAIIIGEGNLRQTLEHQIKKLQLKDNIIMPGFIENASGYLSQFDTFVLSSIKEGLPYTILEAKKAGTPIISTDVGGISSIITHKKTGLLVPPNNKRAIVNALSFAIDNKKEMCSFATTAKKQSEKEQLSIMTAQTISVYKSLVY
jgi:glycosyltransferase involved in cell wall biosynthesis